jgi:hypothetical protein
MFTVFSSDVTIVIDFVTMLIAFTLLSYYFYPYKNDSKSQLIERMKLYEGKLKDALTDKIYLNVNNLKKGSYTLNIVSKNKILKKITFKK